MTFGKTAIATMTVGKSKRESRSKKYARWVQTQKVTPQTLFTSFAQALLASLGDQPFVLGMDGSEVGR